MFLERERIMLRRDRLQRLWLEAGLQVPRKRPRRRTTP
jgi:hypothetical protein